jgi:hypothetical protein
MQSNSKRKTNHILAIFLVMFSAVGVVGVLAWKTSAEANRLNGFKRKVEQIKIKRVNAFARDENIGRIVGANANALYFQTKIPGNFFILDPQLKNPRYMSINIPVNSETATAFSSTVDSPSIKVYLGNMHGVIYGNMIDKKFQFLDFGTSGYTRSVSISDHSFIVRAFDKKNEKLDQIFIRSSPVERKILRENNILERKGDGGIPTDGMLHYDPTTHLITYVFFYHNGFLTLDTNLNLVYKGNTIDTLKSFQTKARGYAVGGEAEFTNYTPSKIVNSTNLVYDGYLYNHSMLKGDNEKMSDFKDNSAIDVYDLKNGSYQGSFYIPAYEDQRMEDFRIYRNTITVLYKNYVVNYELHDGFLKNGSNKDL